MDDFRDHVGGRPAQRALTGAISIAYAGAHATMDLLEDLEDLGDEHDEELARRVGETREAYACGEGRSLEEFIAELERIEE